MFRRIFACSNLTPLTLLCSLLMSEPAAAQQGEHLYEWAGHRGRFASNYSYRGGYRGSNYERPIYYSAPAQATPPSNGPVAGNRAYYPPQSETDYENVRSAIADGGLAVKAPVSIAVSAPADAAIWFDETMTTQRGALRHFVSPPLIPGRDYHYDVLARWTEFGKEVTQSRRIAVHAGDVISISFDSGAFGSRVP